MVLAKAEYAMFELKRVHDELFRRTADECFETFDDLYGHCPMDRDVSTTVDNCLSNWNLTSLPTPFH